MSSINVTVCENVESIVFLRLQIKIVPGIFSYIWAVDWLTRLIAIESFATKHRGQTNPTI